MNEANSALTEYVGSVRCVQLLGTQVTLSIQSKWDTSVEQISRKHTFDWILEPTGNVIRWSSPCPKPCSPTISLVRKWPVRKKLHLKLSPQKYQYSEIRLVHQPYHQASDVTLMNLREIAANPSLLNQLHSSKRLVRMENQHLFGKPEANLT